VSLPLLAATVPISLFSHWVRATRWRRLIGEPVQRWYAFSSVMIGYAVNVVIPRGGEVARVINMNRLTAVPYPKLFATLIAERILDVVVLVGFLGVSVLVDGERLGRAFPMVTGLGSTLVLLAAVGVLLMILLGVSGEFLPRFAGRFAGGLHRGLAKRTEAVVHEGVEGFSVVRKPRQALLATAETAAIWACYWLTFALGLSAFGLLDRVGYRGATVTFSVTSLSVMLPAQGAIGVFHAFGQKALHDLYGIPTEEALAWITVLHAILFLGVGGLCGVLVWGLQLNPERSDSEPPDRLEADLARLAGAHAPMRWAMAKLARRLIVTRAWERLGFARLRDYAVERLGLSARSLYDLAHIDRALTALPRIEDAFLRGEIAWTKVRLIVRAAEPGSEDTWVERARRLTTAALAREVRKTDLGALEGGGLPLDEEDSGGESEGAYDNVRLRCTPQVRAKWHRARQLACRMAGHSVRPWECAEMVAAEVLSALPPVDDGQGTDDATAAGGTTAADDATAAGAGPTAAAEGGACGRVESAATGGVANTGEGPRDHAAVRALVDGLDDAGPFQLDRRLRRAVRLEQRLDAELGARLALAAHEHLHVEHGLPSFEAYVRERLGMAPRKVRALLRLERTSHVSPALGAAYREGRLSWVQAQALIPVLLIGDARPDSDAWIGWAMQVSVRRLEEDVDAALLLKETDPGAFARTAGLPADARGATAGAPSDTEATPGQGACERQVGANSTRLEETSTLFVHAPLPVARLVRAVLCSVRRAIEGQTGRLPTEGQAFEAMLDHALDSWMAPNGRVRAAHRVFERDGWRCTVPGCSSYRNLHDHHIVFRSAGGSDEAGNRTTLCASHHLRGIHAGRLGCSGIAPNGLRFELGLRRGAPALVTFGPGERIVA
jgi:hypothetical protein